MNDFLQALNMVLQWESILAIASGSLFGLVVGSIPGLTISVGMILVIPLTFFLPTHVSIGLLLGIYCSGMTGGSVSAILLDIPGTPSASATGIDGYPMTRKGEAGKALGSAIIGSFSGGMISFLVLILIAPQIAKIALRFGAVELFSLLLLGLALVSSFGVGSAKSLLKALIVAVFGLMLGTIGLDFQSGVARYTFGLTNLQLGVDILPVMIGLFAIPQIMMGAKQGGRKKGGTLYKGNVTASFPSWEEIKRFPKGITIGSLIGTFIGALPGAGGPIAVFLAYDYTKRFSKNKDEFGTGIPEGVVAPEAANNAVTGGALIPALTLGIPGDGITAVLLGALMLQGVKPGPLLFQQSPVLIYATFISLFLANIFNLIIAFATIRLLVQVLRVDGRILLPIIAGFCVIGAFALRNNPIDIAVMLVLGVIGYFLKKGDFPTIPLILAVVLGPAMEEHLRMALTISRGNPMVFLTKPISLAFIILAVISFLIPIFSSKSSSTA